MSRRSVAQSEEARIQAALLKSLTKFFTTARSRAKFEELEMTTIKLHTTDSQRRYPEVYQIANRRRIQCYTECIEEDIKRLQDFTLSPELLKEWEDKPLPVGGSAKMESGVGQSFAFPLKHDTGSDSDPPPDRQQPSSNASTSSGDQSQFSRTVNLHPEVVRARTMFRYHLEALERIITFSAAPSLIDVFVWELRDFAKELQQAERALRSCVDEEPSQPEVVLRRRSAGDFIRHIYERFRACFGFD